MWGSLCKAKRKLTWRLTFLSRRHGSFYANRLFADTAIMAPYFALLSIPAALAFLHERKRAQLLTIPVFLVFVAFAGLRYHVGMDWNNYDAIHWSMLYLSFPEAAERSEPLSFALFWISSHSGWHMTLTNLVCAAILVGGVFSCANRTPNRWLGVLAATPYAIIAFGMSAVRQSLAIGVILFVFAHWQNWTTKYRLMGIAIASLFHTSALFAAILAIFEMRLQLLPKLLAGAAIGGGLIYSLQVSDVYSSSVDAYVDNYLGSSESIVSPGALLHMSLIQIPAIVYLLTQKRLARHVANPRLLWLGSWLSVGLIAVYFVSTTAASRLVLYLYFVPIAVYPALAESVGRANRLATNFAFSVLHMLILAAWLTLANNSYAHIPYRNVLLEDPV